MEEKRKGRKKKKKHIRKKVCILFSLLVQSWNSDYFSGIMSKQAVVKCDFRPYLPVLVRKYEILSNIGEILIISIRVNTCIRKRASE